MFRRSTLVWIGALALVLGIWLSRYTSDVSVFLYILSLCLVPFWKRKDMLAITSVFICSFTLGLFRAVLWSNSLDYVSNKVGDKVVVEGRVITDAVYDERRQTQFEIDSVVFVDDEGRQEVDWETAS